MKKDTNNKPVTEAVFKKFTEGTFRDFTENVFKKFTEGVFRDFTENVFKKTVERLDAKIDGVEKRLDAKIDGVEKRLDAKIDGVEKRLDTKIDGVEKRLDGKIHGLAVSLVNLDGRVTIIEQTMVTKKDLQNTESKILDRMDFLLGNYRTIDQEQMAQALHIKELKETAGQHEVRINALEHRL